MSAADCSFVFLLCLLKPSVCHKTGLQSCQSSLPSTQSSVHTGVTLRGWRRADKLNNIDCTRHDEARTPPCSPPHLRRPLPLPLPYPTHSHPPTPVILLHFDEDVLLYPIMQRKQLSREAVQWEHQKLFQLAVMRCLTIRQSAEKMNNALHGASSLGTCSDEEREN